MRYLPGIFLTALVVAWSSIAVFRLGGVIILVLALAAALVLYKKEAPALFLSFLFGGAAVFYFFLLAPALDAARASSHRGECANNLKEISLAVLNYESQYGSFPPAYIADKNGKPMHSWRVLILPFLEHKDLYDQYSFSEPWDGPNNRKLLSQRPKVFTCYSDEAASKDGAAITDYVAVVGKNAIWHHNKPGKLDDLPKDDSRGQTVMLVEVANSGVNWTEPRDFSLDELCIEGAPSVTKMSLRHMATTDHLFFRCALSRGAYISFADGQTNLLSREALASDDFQRWLTVGGLNRNDVETVTARNDVRDDTLISINWWNCFVFATVILLLVQVGLAASQSTATDVAPKAV